LGLCPDVGPFGEAARIVLAPLESGGRHQRGADARHGVLAVAERLAEVQLLLEQNAVSIDAFSLLHNRRSPAGTLVGGIREAQEMLDFCAGHSIGAQVEVIAADEIDTAYDRVAAGDVRYRFVIDIGTPATG